jgi:MYXO-CTERM domain-containing protein
MRWLSVIALTAACTGQPTGTKRQGLTAAVKAQRYTLIRDTAAQMGVYNGALLAGIAISETNLAHCQSEATYACQGPASSSCGGGPIIAGSADGPCAQMQGGLGMFQFDAGTYADTVNTYGPDILTIEGNSAQAVSFVIDKVIQDVPGTSDWLGAAAWMNGVPLVAGDPVMEQWAALLACRYNGCCSTSTTCTTRAHGYRDNAITAYTDQGGEFWHTSDRCAALPADGVIDQRSTCYIAAGDPRYWRREMAGYAAGLEWTFTTDHAAPSNFAEWIVRAPAGRYHVDVHLDGGMFGQTKQAHYQIAHNNAVDTVVVDQTSASGFVSLGEFDFAGTGDEHVLLGDNTGEASTANTKIAFDAVRVQSIDGPAPDGPGGCGCTAGGRADASGALVLVAAIRVVRRRRRPSIA